MLSTSDQRDHKVYQQQFAEFLYISFELKMEGPHSGLNKKDYGKKKIEIL